MYKLVNRSHVRTKVLAPVVRFAFDVIGAHDVVHTVVVWPTIDEDVGGLSPGEQKHQITCQLNPGRNYPYDYQYPGLKTAPRYDVRNWREHVISTIAHEAFHALEFHAGKSRCSEVLAERAAVKAINAWRADARTGA